ncbi:MAG: hypothetical protein P8P56_04210 [Yoonia sp.]|nr:hypothetical protein [Yoonia sp.]
MRNLLLSVALITGPVIVFAAAYNVLTPAATTTASVAAPSLGDMTPFATIATDLQAIVATGDLAAAKTRIADLETAWDDAQPTMQPLNPADWGNVDGAIDDALKALRSGTPDASTATTTLAALQTTLLNPSKGSAAPSGAATTVSGVVTTDANGRTLPCEVMLETFRTTLVGATLTDANRTAVDELGTKGTERCNADDDTRAADFFAQGIALMSN